MITPSPRSPWRCAVLLVVLAEAVSTASAAGWVFRADPGASSVTFTLGATAHTVHGTFRLRSGEIVFDLPGGEASGQIVVDAGSGATGNASRDRKMHGEVLESARFPEIVLTAHHIVGLEELVQALGGTRRPVALQLTATLALHGTTHEVTIPLEAEVAEGHVQVSGRFRVPYVSWGLKDPSVFILRVSKDVDVSVTVRGDLAAR